VIELDDLGSRCLVHELEGAGQQTFLDELINESDPGDHFEGRGVGGGCPGTVVDFGFGFEQGYRVTPLRARQRRDDADGTTAGYEDAGWLHLKRVFGIN